MISQKYVDCYLLKNVSLQCTVASKVVNSNAQRAIVVSKRN